MTPRLAWRELGSGDLQSALVCACRCILPESYLEIGVRDGDSLLAVLGAAPQLKRLVLCDTWGPTMGGTNRGSHGYIAALLATAGYSGSVQYLDGDSRQTLPTLPAYVQEHLDYYWKLGWFRYPPPGVEA